MALHGCATRTDDSTGGGAGGGEGGRGTYRGAGGGQGGASSSSDSPPTSGATGAQAPHTVVHGGTHTHFYGTVQLHNHYTCAGGPSNPTRLPTTTVRPFRPLPVRPGGAIPRTPLAGLAAAQAIPSTPHGPSPFTPPIVPIVAGGAEAQAIPTTPQNALTLHAQLHNALTTAAQTAVLQPAQHAHPTGVGRGLEGAGEGDDRPPKKSRSADV